MDKYLPGIMVISYSDLSTIECSTTSRFDISAVARVTRPRFTNGYTTAKSRIEGGEL